MEHSAKAYTPVLTKAAINGAKTVANRCGKRLNGRPMSYPTARIEFLIVFHPDAHEWISGEETGVASHHIATLGERNVSVEFLRFDVGATHRVYVDNYNHHRPHRARGLTPPAPSGPPLGVADRRSSLKRRRDRLGGLLHEYELAA